MPEFKYPKFDHIGEAKQVADMALFLVSPASDFITGQNIINNSGMKTSINTLKEIVFAYK